MRRDEHFATVRPDTGEELSAPASLEAGAEVTARLRQAVALTASPLIRLFAVWLLLVIVLSLTAGNFLTVGNFLNIGRATAVFGIAALGVTVALIAGSLDVSFGAVMSLCGIVAAELLSRGDGFVVAILGALTVGIGLGAINGLLVVLLQMDALIVTLGTLSIFGGYAFLHSGGMPTSAPGSAFAEMGRGTWLGIPISVLLMLALAIALGLLLRFTDLASAATWSATMHVQQR